MNTSIKLGNDEKAKSIDIMVYKGMVSSLLYLTANIPDIMFSVCLCARFQASPKESNLHVVKRIIRYVKGTSSCGLFYPKHTSFELIGYCDADFARSKIDCKSPSAT